MTFDKDEQLFGESDTASLLALKSGRALSYVATNDMVFSSGMLDFNDIPKAEIVIVRPNWGIFNLPDMQYFLQKCNLAKRFDESVLHRTEAETHPSIYMNRIRRFCQTDRSLWSDTQRTAYAMPRFA